MKKWEQREEHCLDKTVDVELACSMRFSIARQEPESDQVCLVSLDRDSGEVISYDIEDVEEMDAMILAMQQIKELIWGKTAVVKPQS